MNPLLTVAAVISLLCYFVIASYAGWQTALAVYILVFISNLDKDIFK